MISSADQCTLCKTVHQPNVILIIKDAVLLLDGAGIHQIIVHVAIVLITEYQVNFEEKISKTNLCKLLINSLCICSEIAAASSCLSKTLNFHICNSKKIQFHFRFFFWTFYTNHVGLRPSLFIPGLS